MNLKSTKQQNPYQVGYWIEVENIPKHSNHQKVIELFHKIGIILNDVVIENGKCLIQYENKSDALNACKLDKRSISHSKKILSVHFISQQ